MIKVVSKASEAGSAPLILIASIIVIWLTQRVGVSHTLGSLAPMVSFICRQHLPPVMEDTEVDEIQGDLG